MSDLISRQAAIKAVSEYGCIWMEYTRGMTKDEIAQRALNNAKATMIRIIKELPSAQSEPFMVTIDHELTKDEVERLKQSMSNTSIVLFPSVQPEPQWIPCSERLPRQGQEVICQCRANIINVLKLDACGDWYQDAEHCYMSGFVIAWMPLPEPYREEVSD